MHSVNYSQKRTSNRININTALTFLYTFIAVYSTLFELYGISEKYHTFTWRIAFVLIFLILTIIAAFSDTRILISRFFICFLPFFLCVVISFFVNVLIGTEGFELRLIRFFILMIFAVLVSPKYFDGKLAYKMYGFLVWIATIVLLLQVIFATFFGTIFPGHVSFLPLRSTIYEHANFMRRYYSIFEEPGYYGIYVLPYVCIMLTNGKIKLFKLICILSSLLLSTSTSNLAVFGFILFTYVIFVHNEKIIGWREYVVKIFIVLAGILIIYYFTQTEQYLFVLKRLNSGVSLESRMTGYSDFAQYFEGHILMRLFGNGMESYPISGYATLIIVFGIVGALGYIYGIIRLFHYTNREGKYLLFAFMFINVGNVEFLGNASSMLIVLPYVIWYAIKKTENETIVID